MTQPLIFRTCHPDDLSPDTFTQWAALCDSNALYGSPILSPEFAQVIGSIRSDTRVILAFDQENLAACMTIHHRPLGFARALGAPFDDYSGPIVAKGYDIKLKDMLRAAGRHSYRAGGAIVRPEATIPISQQATCFSITLGNRTPQAYLEERRTLHPKRFKNFRRLMRKLESDHGEVDFHFGAPNPADLDKLLAWKSTQFVSEGMVDLTKASMSKAVLAAVADKDAKDKAALSAFMISLYLNGNCIAGHYGIARKGYFHPWISAYDKTFNAYAPGILLLQKLLEAMPEMGVKSYDLAGGHAHYKKYFAEDGRQVYAAHYDAKTTLGTLHALGYRAWDLLGARNDETIAARMRRRLDHIACCESGLGMRATEFGIAIRKRH